MLGGRLNRLALEHTSAGAGLPLQPGQPAWGDREAVAQAGRDCATEQVAPGAAQNLEELTPCDRPWRVLRRFHRHCDAAPPVADPCAWSRALPPVRGGRLSIGQVLTSSVLIRRFIFVPAHMGAADAPASSDSRFPFRSFS